MSAPPPAGRRVRPAQWRSSCDTCATAKIGCTKEKPACARCAKRDLPCSYSVTKRAGRTSHSRAQQKARDAAYDNAVPNSPADRTADGMAIDTLQSIVSPMALSPSTSSNAQMSSAFSDLFASLLSPQQAQAGLMPATSTFELDELFASATPVLPRDYPTNAHSSPVDFDFFGDGGTPVHNIPSAGSRKLSEVGASLFPVSDAEATALPTPVTGSTSSHGSQNNVHNSPTISDFGASGSGLIDPPSVFQAPPGDSGCSCLTRALGLLSEPLPHQARSRDPCSSPPSFQDVLVQNHRACNTVAGILQCTCATDPYVLVVLALVTFTLFEWWAAAAGIGQNEGLVQPPRAGMGGYDSEGEDLGRIAGQVVLSKLHGVQRVVNLLAQQLQGLQQPSSVAVNVNAPFESSMQTPLQEGKPISAPLSTRLSQSLEAEMKQRLRDLARSIIERLQ